MTGVARVCSETMAVLIATQRHVSLKSDYHIRGAIPALQTL
jgi:hypothetical protein